MYNYVDHGLISIPAKFQRKTPNYREVTVGGGGGDRFAPNEQKRHRSATFSCGIDLRLKPKVSIKPNEQTRVKVTLLHNWSRHCSGLHFSAMSGKLVTSDSLIKVDYLGGQNRWS